MCLNDEMLTPQYYNVYMWKHLDRRDESIFVKAHC